MSSIGDILAGAAPKTPPEIDTIKRFVNKEFNYTPQVRVSKFSITIQLENAAMAGEMRQRQLDLKKELQTDKKILLRFA